MPKTRRSASWFRLLVTNAWISGILQLKLPLQVRNFVHHFRLFPVPLRLGLRVRYNDNLSFRASVDSRVDGKICCIQIVDFIIYKFLFVPLVCQVEHSPDLDLILPDKVIRDSAHKGEEKKDKQNPEEEICATLGVLVNRARGRNRLQNRRAGRARLGSCGPGSVEVASSRLSAVSNHTGDTSVSAA